MAAPIKDEAEGISSVIAQAFKPMYQVSETESIAHQSRLKNKTPKPDKHYSSNPTIN